MRQKIHQQARVAPAWIAHDHAKEMWEISAILEELPELPRLLALIEADVLRGSRSDTGREGMTADQVLRVLIVKKMRSFKYEELAFAIADSSTYGAFCRMGVGSKPRGKSALNDNIKRLRPTTLEAVNRMVLKLAKTEGVEDGERVRGDCTNVETNVHRPTDSSLLNDSVRVLTRLMRQADEYVGGLRSDWSDHTRRARRRAFGISNSRRREQRTKLYSDLLKVTERTVDYAWWVEWELREWWPSDDDLERWFTVANLRGQLLHFMALTRHVIDQTKRRLLRGEKVPATEKVFSIFEPHTDIIVKGGRDTEFGHKIFLTTGKSGLVLDCQVLKGNPADSTLVEQFFERHVEIYGKPPREVAFDGGFTSRGNLEFLKKNGVQDAAFHKKRGLQVHEMVRSSSLYRDLTRFRAGVEAGISFLKRCFGLTRCMWRGFESFVAYTWASALTSNLLLLARHRLARSP